jgi:hypothetical protein
MSVGWLSKRINVTAIESILEINTTQSNEKVYPLRVTVTGSLKIWIFSPPAVA